MCYRLHAELVMLLEWWSGTDCTLYTDQATVDKFGTEHVIVILNHNFEIDFLCGWTMCERYGVLGVSNAPKYVFNYYFSQKKHFYLNLSFFYVPELMLVNENTHLSSLSRVQKC